MDTKEWRKFLRKRAKELYKNGAGESITMISHRLGIDENLVKKLLRRSGVKLEKAVKKKEKSRIEPVKWNPGPRTPIESLRAKPKLLKAMKEG